MKHQAIVSYIALAASLLGCHRPTTPNSDAGAATAASTSLAAPDASPPMIAADFDASSKPRVPSASTDGTIGLLVEHVLLDPGQEYGASHYGFDLLVLTTPPGKKATRSQPFCPPLERNMYEVCRRFQSCKVGDAGTPLTCDGKSFELVQHDGATYLHGEDREIEVSKATPSIVSTTTRERHAYIDL